MLNTAEAKKACIVIVEDSELHRRMISDALRPDGYSLVFEKGPIGATASIMRNKADLALIDVNLPAFSGSKLVEQIRKRKAVKNTRLLLFSSLSEEDLQILQMQCGADGYIHKPDDFNELRPIIKEWLEKAKP